jgi:hypothetical protein
MRSIVAVIVSGLLNCVVAFGQSPHFLYICYICDLVNGCYPIGTSVLGG